MDSGRWIVHDSHESSISKVNALRHYSVICGVISSQRHPNANAFIKGKMRKGFAFVVPRNIFRIWV